MQNSWYPTWAAWGMVAALCCSSLRADDSVIQKIREDWRARRSLVKRVEYRVRGQTTYCVGYGNDSIAELGVGPPLKPGENLPDKEFTSPLEARVLLDFEQKRVRKESEQHQFVVMQRAFKRSFNAYLYDGKEFQVYRPRDRSEYAGEFGIDLLFDVENRGGTFFDSGDYPFFFGHGVVSVKDVNKVGPNQPELDFSQFRLTGPKSIDGRNIVVMRSPASPYGVFKEYTIDLDRQSAVVGWALRESNDYVRSLEVEYAATERGWFPVEWTNVDFEDGKPRRTTTIHQVSITFDPIFETSDFHIEVRPGMTVEDRRTGASYVVGEDGYKRDLQMVRLRQEEQSSSRPTLAIKVSIALACAAVIAFVVFRKLKG